MLWIKRLRPSSILCHRIFDIPVNSFGSQPSSRAAGQPGCHAAIAALHKAATPRPALPAAISYPKDTQVIRSMLDVHPDMIAVAQQSRHRVKPRDQVRILIEPMQELSRDHMVADRLDEIADGAVPGPFDGIGDIPDPDRIMRCRLKVNDCARPYPVTASRRPARIRRALRSPASAPFPGAQIAGRADGKHPADAMILGQNGRDPRRIGQAKRG